MDIETEEVHGQGGVTGLFQDTTPEAERLYWKTIAAMTPGERIAQAKRLTQRVRNFTLAGIRAQHPEYNDRQLTLALHRRLWRDDDLFRLVYPGAMELLGDE